MRDINEICDYIIFRIKSDEGNGIGLSNIKLQKLLYYTQAWYLAYNDNTPLFRGNFQAWIHGPVNRAIFSRFKPTKFMFSEINLTDIINKDIDSLLTKDEKNHINSVLDAYAGFSGLQLEDMSHKETPWISAREGFSPNQRCEKIIENNVLGNYFRERITPSE